jgi:hypothetical protein
LTTTTSGSGSESAPIASGPCAHVVPVTERILKSPRDEAKHRAMRSYSLLVKRRVWIVVESMRSLD